MRAAVALLCVSACSAPGPIALRVEPVERAPLQVKRLATPSRAAAAWAGPEGDGLLALESGELLRVDAAGNTLFVLPAAGEPSTTRPTTGFVERDANTVLALGPEAQWVLTDGSRAAVLPEFLSAPTGLGHAGRRVFWASRRGVHTTIDGAWVRLDDAAGPVIDATTLIGSDQGAWVLRSASLQRVSLDDGIEWTRTGLKASHLASMGDGRVVAITDLGVSILRGDEVTHFEREAAGGKLLPTAVSGGGGFAWLLWGGSLLRTDGTRWEALLSDAAFGPTATISVDVSGAAALLIDADGQAWRVLAQEALRLRGLAEESWITSAADVPLDAVVEPALAPLSVSYALDGLALASRTAAPFGWGTTGEAVRTLMGLTEGTHHVDVEVQLADGGVLNRTRTFFVQSTPGDGGSNDGGSVLSYAADIAPLYETNCARCHSRAVARDLSTYATLTADVPRLRAAISSRRMPSDILLDPAAFNALLEWIDSGAGP